jgi:hypothetical protein
LRIAVADLEAAHPRYFDLSAPLDRLLRRGIGAGDICSIGGGFGIAFGWFAHLEIVKSVGLGPLSLSRPPRQIIEIAVKSVGLRPLSLSRPPRQIIEIAVKSVVLRPPRLSYSVDNAAPRPRLPCKAGVRRSVPRTRRVILTGPIAHDHASIIQ